MNTYILTRSENILGIPYLYKKKHGIKLESHNLYW